MRKLLNLDLQSLDRFTMLIHGNYGVGKTHLIGDMLKYYMETPLKQDIRALGGVPRPECKGVHFINIAGEDGYLTMANAGLGESGETVDTFKDWEEAIQDATKAKYAAIAIDGIKHLGKLVIRHNCGDRLPSVGKGSDDWQKIHRDLENTITGLRSVAPVVLCASSSDRSMDQISGEISLTPDLPGRQATGVGGMFDFVFVLAAQVVGPNKVKRTLKMAPQSNTVIRARLPNALPSEIILPEGHGGWALVLKTLEETLTKR